MTGDEQRETAKPYHHGALREALLDAAERELIEKGEDGFSLRSTAKRAGVSHAAPAHHFRDVTALLHGVAQRGFERLTEAMRAEQAETGTHDPEAHITAAAVGYVRFAIDNPELFRLMFSGRATTGEKPDELARAGDAALSVVVNAIGRLRGRDTLATEEGWREVTATWAIVHGYADLAISGKIAWLTDRPFELQRPVLADFMARALRL